METARCPPERWRVPATKNACKTKGDRHQLGRCRASKTFAVSCPGWRSVLPLRESWPLRTQSSVMVARTAFLCLRSVGFEVIVRNPYLWDVLDYEVENELGARRLSLATELQ